MKGSLNYVKVILYAYPRLKGYADALDCSLENMAMLSFLSREGTLSVAEKMVEQMAISRALLLLEEELEGVLVTLSDRERLLLEYKYFRRKKGMEALEGVQNDCSERSYFRRQNELLQKLGAIFVGRGWSEQWFMRTFGNYTPFMCALKNVREGKDRTKKRNVQNSKSSCAGGADFFPRRTRKRTATTDTPRATRKNITVGERVLPSASPCAGGASSTGGVVVCK